MQYFKNTKTQKKMRIDILAISFNYDFFNKVYHANNATACSWLQHCGEFGEKGSPWKDIIDLTKFLEETLRSFPGRLSGSSLTSEVHGADLLLSKVWFFPFKLSHTEKKLEKKTL